MIHAITKSEEPVFDPDAFTIVGKEMDGFESRRFRAFSSVKSETPEMIFNPDAHDVIDLRLKNRANVFIIEISTEWFTGNQVRRASIALRLQRDLGVNLAGVALALDLLDELNGLRVRVSRNSEIPD